MIEETKVCLSDLHFENMQWLSNLRFYDEEFRIFNRRLEEVIERYTETDKKAKIEHFQNRFILHHDAINKLIKAVNHHEKLMVRLLANTTEIQGNIPMVEHSLLRDKIETEKKLYIELKGEYYRFLTQGRVMGQ